MNKQNERQFESGMFSFLMRWGPLLSALIAVVFSYAVLSQKVSNAEERINQLDGEHGTIFSSLTELEKSNAAIQATVKSIDVRTQRIENLLVK